MNRLKKRSIFWQSTIGVIAILLIACTFYYFLPEKRLPFKIDITKLVVLKSKHQLLVFSNSKLIKTYKISLGFNTTGKKEFDQDGKTPEGLYFINAKNPNSTCHKNLGISYPNRTDIDNAKAADKKPGGDIKIHGLPNGKGFIGKFQRWYDWTNGCIGLTNYEIDDLYKHISIGTPIELKP